MNTFLSSMSVRVLFLVIVVAHGSKRSIARRQEARHMSASSCGRGYTENVVSEGLMCIPEQYRNFFAPALISDWSYLVVFAACGFAWSPFPCVLMLFRNLQVLFFSVLSCLPSSLRYIHKGIMIMFENRRIKLNGNESKEAATHMRMQRR